MPYCRYVQDECGSISAMALSENRRRPRRQVMSDWLDGNKARPDDMDGHAISLISAGALIRRRAGIDALNGADPRRHHAGALLCRKLPVLDGPEFAGRRQAQHQGPLRRADARLHVDLDNDVIIDRGKFADEKMRVMRVAR
jgi:hypothetical protein